MAALPGVLPLLQPAPIATKPTVTFAARCRELISQGLTNAEVWAIIQPEYNSPDKCKSHPAWYRNQMKRVAEGKGGRSSKVTAYSTTLAWFIENQPKAKSVINAAEPSFAIKLLAQATGRDLQMVVNDLKARIVK